MRVCQFRHYGTVFTLYPKGPSTLTATLQVLQTQRRLSIPRVC